MTTCEEIIELLPAYALDACDERDRAVVDKHLAGGCPTCRAERDAFADAAASLAELSAPERPPADLKSGLMERLAEGNRVDVATFTPASRRSWLAAAPYVAAAIAAVAVGATLGLRATPRDDRGSEVDVRRWRQQIADAERLLGSPATRPATLRATPDGAAQRLSLFLDELTGELHVVLPVAPSTVRGRLVVWGQDAAGEVITSGRLDAVSSGGAIGVLALGDLPVTPAKLVITDEPDSKTKVPAGEVLGVWNLERIEPTQEPSP